MEVTWLRLRAAAFSEPTVQEHWKGLKVELPSIK
jgi:hypothetical protein